MPGIDAIIASERKRLSRSENSNVRQPLKIVAAPNDVMVYYADRVLVYHAEGEGSERYNISQAVYNLATEIEGAMSDEPEFAVPTAVSEEIRIPAEDPYYKQASGG